MILIIIRMKVLSEKRMELSQTIASLVGSIRMESGCNRCDFCQRMENGNQLFLLEEWDTEENRQQVVFRTTISNGSRNSGRVTLAIKDRDEIISEVRDVPLRPGDNQVEFPESPYRFSRSDHCFTVEADIQRTRSPIDTSREFCAKRTNLGWTLSDKGIGPLYVEELEMYPDPATPGQEIRFRVRLRNDGRPIRGHVRIQEGRYRLVELPSLYKADLQSWKIHGP